MPDRRVVFAIMETASTINEMCDKAQVDETRRSEMHRYHGEMIARGVETPQEIVRMIASALTRQEAIDEAHGAA